MHLHLHSLQRGSRSQLCKLQSYAKAQGRGLKNRVLADVANPEMAGTWVNWLLTATVTGVLVKVGVKVGDVPCGVLTAVGVV